MGYGDRHRAVAGGADEGGGVMETALGTLWPFPSPYEYPTTAPIEPVRVEHVVCPCNTPGDFPQPCGIHQPWLPLASGVHIQPAYPPRLSDDDIERIAQRVAALLKPKARKRR